MQYAFLLLPPSECCQTILFIFSFWKGPFPSFKTHFFSSLLLCKLVLYGTKLHCLFSSSNH